MVNVKLALTIQEAAAATGVGRTTIFEEIRRNQLIARKIGRRTVILKDDLDTWLKSRPNKSAVRVLSASPSSFEEGSHE
jgi:excisionase family DNA binding protein